MPFFCILKGRQLGITTISLALDLYWHFTHPGLQGTLTTDTEENRDMFRSTTRNVHGWFTQRVQNPDPYSQQERPCPQKSQSILLSSRWA